MHAGTEYLLRCHAVTYIMAMQLVHFLTFKSTKHRFYNNKVSELAVSNPKQWWKQVKSLTGQDISPKQE